MLSAIGCEKFHKAPGMVLKLAIHGADEFFFILVEHSAPAVFGLEVDEIFGVEESGGVGSVIRAPDL